MADDNETPVQLAVSNRESGQSGQTSGETSGQSSGKSSQKPASSRPTVVSLSYPDRKSLLKAYMPFLKNGGLFLPTSTPRDMNEEIFLIVTLPESDKPIPVPGTVVWKTPAGAVDSKPQGVGIEFKGREGNSLRSRIEGLLGAKLTGGNPTHTM